MSSRFTVRYRVVGSESDARRMAELICVDQTVEAAEAVIPPGPIRERILGRVESFVAIAPNRWEAAISYAGELLGSSCAQLLQVLFGTSSLKRGIRVARLDFPETILSAWTGPRFGRDGLRKLVGVTDRPLVCAVLKPLGMGTKELADLAYQFALGGVDLVKDDQGLEDHPFCPFDERASRCAEAVARANRETGRTTLYIPHVTAPWEELLRRCLHAKRAGAGGVLICPGLVGFDAIRDVAHDDSIALPILSHPSLLGSYYVHEDSGIASSVLFGQLPRLAGADVSIYPTYGLDFPMSRNDCRSVGVATGEPWGHVKPILPTAAGRMGFERVREIFDLYGKNVVFILGSSVRTAGPSVEEACRTFMELVRRSAEHF